MTGECVGLVECPCVTLTTGATIVINQYGWYLADPQTAPLTPAEAAEAWAKYDERVR